MTVAEELDQQLVSCFNSHRFYYVRASSRNASTMLSPTDLQREFYTCGSRPIRMASWCGFTRQDKHSVRLKCRTPSKRRTDKRTNVQTPGIQFGAF